MCFWGSSSLVPERPCVSHTDFEKGFIKVEVVSFKDLDASGAMADAKAADKVRMEGKDYVMQDGDVVEFRFNFYLGNALQSPLCRNLCANNGTFKKAESPHMGQ